MLILGSCKFGFDYNGKQVEKKEVFKILEYFEKNGGKIVDSAHNYRQAIPIISEYLRAGSNLKIITKIKNIEEFDIDYSILKQDKIYCCMARENANLNLINNIKKLQTEGFIEKTGMSIYYPHELRSDMNIVFIPNNFNNFIYYMQTMILHSSIYVRSFFNLNNKDFKKALFDYQKFSYYEREDLNHFVQPVIGVSSLKQLKYNMKHFI